MEAFRIKIRQSPWALPALVSFSFGEREFTDVLIGGGSLTITGSLDEIKQLVNAMQTARPPGAASLGSEQEDPDHRPYKKAKRHTKEVKVEEVQELAQPKKARLSMAEQMRQMQERVDEAARRADEASNRADAAQRNAGEAEKRADEAKRTIDRLQQRIPQERKRQRLDDDDDIVRRVSQAPRGPRRPQGRFPRFQSVRRE